MLLGLLSTILALASAASAQLTSSSSSSSPAGTGMCNLEWPPGLGLAAGVDKYEAQVAPPATADLLEVLKRSHDLPDDAAEAVEGRNVVFVHSLNHIQEVSQVDDLRQRFTMPLYSQKMWFDTRLVLDPTVESLEVSEDFFKRCLWAPNFIYAFLMEARVWEMVKKPFVFRLYRDPSSNLTVVSQTSYLTVTLSCIMDFDLYPFDKQICYVLETALNLKDVLCDNCSAVSEATSGVTPASSASGGASFHFAGNFVHFSVSQRQLQYEMRIEKMDDELLQNGKLFGLPLSYYGWKILLKRKLHIHVSEVFQPTATYVGLSWLSFLIPPEVVPGRMALLITLVLVLVNVSNSVASAVPSMDKFTALGFWVSICIFMVVFAIMEYGVILFLRRRNLLRVDKSRFGGGVGSTRRKTKTRKDEEADARLAGLAIDAVAMVAFPVVSALGWLCYWIHYTSKYESDFDDLPDAIEDAFTLPMEELGMNIQ